MGRKRRRGRTKTPGGGMMSSMRGGFRSVVGTSAPAAQGGSRTRRVVMNVLTVALLVAVAVVVLRRFGILKWP